MSVLTHVLEPLGSAIGFDTDADAASYCAASPATTS